jgi:hypothetical protein
VIHRIFNSVSTFGENPRIKTPETQGKALSVVAIKKGVRHLGGKAMKGKAERFLILHVTEGKKALVPAQPA